VQKQRSCKCSNSQQYAIQPPDQTGSEHDPIDSFPFLLQRPIDRHEDDAGQQKVGLNPVAQGTSELLFREFWL
jgi:hypothetical protein